MIYYITIFMFFLCVTTMVTNLEGHLTPRLYLWEMRKQLIKDSGAWYSLIGRDGVRFYRRTAFRRVSHSQGIEQVISLCDQMNISFTTQCDQWNRDECLNQSDNEKTEFRGSFFKRQVTTIKKKKTSYKEKVFTKKPCRPPLIIVQCGWPSWNPFLPLLLVQRDWSASRQLYPEH